MEYIIEYKSSLYSGGKARHIFNKAEAESVPIKTNVKHPFPMSIQEANLFQAMENNNVIEAKGTERFVYKIKK